jgi:hypothetical protein
MSENKPIGKDDSNLVLGDVLEQLKTVNERITRLEFKIDVLASQILQLRADQLYPDSHSDEFEMSAQG